MRGAKKVQTKSAVGSRKARAKARSKGGVRKSKVRAKYAGVAADSQITLTPKGLTATEHVVDRGHLFIVGVGGGGAGIKDTNPKDAAASTRLDLSLFPMSAVAHGAHAMAEGNLKYGGFNWREAGVLASVYVAAAMRHLFKWFNGQEHDPKTLVHELGSVMACAAILIDAIESGKLVDDRPPSQDMAAMLDRFETKVKHLHTVFPPAKSPGRYTQKRRAA